MTTETRSLHRKLAEVMEEAERIPKNGTAPAAIGGFKFVQVGDAADFIRKALGKRKVSMLPTQVEIVGQTEHATIKGGTLTTAELRITWTLTDGESGESATFQSYGVGADTGDKYSGKATTTAMKYALLSGWQLSTGDDVEQTDTSDRRARANGSTVVQRAPEIERDDSGGLIGIAELGKSNDTQYELRQEKTRGHVLGFRLVSGRKGFKVLAFGPMAEALAVVRSEVIGKRVTCWGQMVPESFDKTQADGTTRTITYNVLHLEKIVTPEWILPMDEAADAPPADDREPQDVPWTDEELAQTGVR